MENRDMNDNRWVEDRMRSLDVHGTWQPNAARALARMKARRQERKERGKKPLGWAAGGLSLVALAIGARPSRGTCAQGRLNFGCSPPAVAEHLQSPDHPQKQPAPQKGPVAAA